MTRQTIYTICTFLLLGIATVGATYAFYSASASSNNNSVAAEASPFEVIYTGGTEINGNMPITSDKTEAFKTTVNIRIADNSVNALSNLYINIENISNELQVEGFVWELYGYKNNTQIYYKKGNFEGYNSTNNNKVPLISNYQTDKTNTSFTLYLWIDGNKTGNEVIGTSFKGYIGASTEQFTGQLG